MALSLAIPSGATQARDEPGSKGDGLAVDSLIWANIGLVELHYTMGQEQEPRLSMASS
jgi:hypothetical protein